jgi:D-glycero-D-manno-heptose 1,7-bisphosphate phosphatase
MTGGRPAVFIDKDGTLIHDVPYNADPALLHFQPGATEALALLSVAGFALLIVTNQSGLALGRFSAEQFARLQCALEQRLQHEAGVRLTGFCFCPHAPGRDGLPACACRKPQPGMLLDAAQQHGLDLERSWMVGDTLDDVEAGHRAGCRSLLFDSGGETVWRDGPLRRPDRRCTDWEAVARHVMASRRALAA